MKRTLRRVQREDHTRVLLTETANYDVPIIFSNLGFYWHWKKFMSGKSRFPELMKAFFKDHDSQFHHTIPEFYEIRKNETSSRILALIHPLSQVGFIDFYRKFDQQIILACTKSRFSIRYPASVGGKYFVRNDLENISKYKSRFVSTPGIESRARYMTTYFSYRSHARLHKFFRSNDFRQLEQKYVSFWSMDVAKCFDNIYTHSIAWALRNKEYAKEHTSDSSFASTFDKIMQSLNHKETAGIVVGAEISRIFAEIIFQEIDRKVLLELERSGVVEGQHYSVRRYVDDILIFAKSTDIASQVSTAYADELRVFKLSCNEAKALRVERPFLTDESRAVRSVSEALEKLRNDVFSANDGVHALKLERLRSIRNRSAFVGALLEQMKIYSNGSSTAYRVLSGYVISSLSNLVLRFIDANLDADLSAEEDSKKVAVFFEVFAELVFHLYTISPSSNSSLKIALLIHNICEFSKRMLASHEHRIRHSLYQRVVAFLENSNLPGRPNDPVSVETLNVIAAARAIGPAFRLSQSHFRRHFCISNRGSDFTYFEIITLLYYIGDDKSGEYDELLKKVRKDISAALKFMGDVRKNSSKAHLLFDMLACPYLDVLFRSDLNQRLWKELMKKDIPGPELAALTTATNSFEWFTSWDEAAVASMLEKKVLLNSY